MSSPRLATAMAALTATFQASSALAGVTISQGGGAPAIADPDFIIVGHDGALLSDGSLAEITQAGTFTTQFIADGQPPMAEETGAIHVVAVSQTGDSTDLPARVTRAQALLSACADACADLRSGDITFDLAGNGSLMTRQPRTAGQGCGAIFSFTITYSSPW